MKISKEEINKMNRADEFYHMSVGENKRRCKTHDSQKQYKRKGKYKKDFSEAE
jgi:hypothetical protein